MSFSRHTLRFGSHPPHFMNYFGHLKYGDLQQRRLKRKSCRHASSHSLSHLSMDRIQTESTREALPIRFQHVWPHWPSMSMCFHKPQNHMGMQKHIYDRTHSCHQNSVSTCTIVFLSAIREMLRCPQNPLFLLSPSAQRRLWNKQQQRERGDGNISLIVPSSSL